MHANIGALDKSINLRTMGFSPACSGPDLGCPSNTPFTLDAVSPTAIGIWQKAPVHQLLSKVCMQPCDTVGKHSLPCASYGSFKMIKMSASEFGTLTIRRRM